MPGSTQLGPRALALGLLLCCALASLAAAGPSSSFKLPPLPPKTRYIVHYNKAQTGGSLSTAALSPSASGLGPLGALGARMKVRDEVDDGENSFMAVEGDDEDSAARIANEMRKMKGVTLVEVDQPRAFVGWDHARGQAWAQAVDQALLQGGPAEANQAAPSGAAAQAGTGALEQGAGRTGRRLMQGSSNYGIAKVQANLFSSAQRANTDASGTSGNTKTVCIIDSGINMRHPAFAGIRASGFPTGWDTDTCGHGTHVAGTVAGRVPGFELGVLTNNTRLYIVKVFSGAACGWVYASSLADAMLRCVRDGGAKVISMSLGGSFSVQAEERMVNELTAQGTLIVAAAGNSGTSALSWPAAYANVVSVAATDAGNLAAGFSTFNNDVEVAAPGVSVYSPYLGGSSVLTLRTPSRVFSGTTSVVRMANLGAAAFTPVAGRALGVCPPGGCTSSMQGRVCVMLRASNSSGNCLLVQSCRNQGGVAAVVYSSSSAAGLAVTLTTRCNPQIPGFSVSTSIGQELVRLAATPGAVVDIGDQTSGGYAFLSGTSMATPHYAGVASMIWYNKPRCSAAQIRQALSTTALDAGTPRRDTRYGFGIIRARNAHDSLTC